MRPTTTATPPCMERAPGDTIRSSSTSSTRVLTPPRRTRWAKRQRTCHGRAQSGGADRSDSSNSLETIVNDQAAICFRDVCLGGPIESGEGQAQGGAFGDSRIEGSKSGPRVRVLGEKERDASAVR